MNVKCFFGFHTDLIDSRYQFKAYNNVEIERGVLLGCGSITAYYYKNCGNCGKDLGEQKFSMGWYAKGTMENSPHSLEECINKARAFQSNRG